MATINTFLDSFRQFKVKFEIDFGSGFVDRTQFLKSFNLFQELSEVSYGICETTAYFELTVSNPSSDWTKQGLPVKYTIGISDDQGASYFDVVVFEGKTSRRSTVSRNQVKIEAKDKLFEILSKNPSSRLLFTNTLTSTIVSQIVNNTALGQAVSYSDILNYPISYIQSNDQSLAEQLLDFAKIHSSIVVFDSNTIIFINLQNVGMRNIYTLQGDIPLSKVGIGKYNQNQTLSEKEYFNVFRARGTQYISTTNIFQGNFSGIKIEPQQTIFIDNLDLKGLIPATISSVNSVFRNTDDDTGGILSASLLSSSIVSDETILLKFKNTNTVPIYLRSLNIVGTGLQPLSSIEEVWENTSQITADGNRINFTIDSPAIQWEGSCDNLVNIQKSFTNNYFEFTALWSPLFLVGRVVTARTPSGATIYGLITNIKVQQVKSLTATIKLRQFIPNNINWFTINSSPINNASFPVI